MFVYLAAPYSSIQDKDALMTFVMKVSGTFMMQYPGHHVVSPLFNHYSLHLVSGMGSDYEFWKNYSQDLLARCNILYVLKINGSYESIGVKDEIEFAKSRNIAIRFITVDADFNLIFSKE